MDEREALDQAVHQFNGHPLDWQNVYGYVNRRSKDEFTNPMDITEIVTALELWTPHYTEQIWRFIEGGTEMLQYLRRQGRL